jgi:hypothetical protein
MGDATLGVCPAEDANNNGFVESGEVGDLDNDVLEPNGAAIVRSLTSTGIERNGDDR